MDLIWFLKQRTEFIRGHYDTAVAPFVEIIRNIEEGIEPYEPVDIESGDPEYEIEWGQANTSIEMLGASCVSMLSESLKLYFSTCDRHLGLNCGEVHKQIFRSQGFLHGYKACLGAGLSIDWATCPADLAIIEQVVLARNDAAHPSELTDLRLQHADNTRNRHRYPFFMSEDERALVDSGAFDEFAGSNLALVVTRDQLFRAIEQVEMLGDWLELRVQSALWPHGDAAQEL